MQDKKEHRASMLQKIAEWHQSDLTQKAFCAANNITYHVFHYWYAIYKSDQNATNSFLPVNIQPAANSDKIILTGVNGIQVQFALTDQSVRFIKRLLLPEDAAS